jgi:hypothetical protein
MTERHATNTLDLLSGPWTGVWRQGESNQGKESLDLVFQDGQVLGFGDDKDGQFQFTGTFDGTGGVCLGKVYTCPIGPVPARMTYAGFWNGRRILGTWSDDSCRYNSGPFRMWPGNGPDPGEVLETGADIPEEAELELVHALPMRPGITRPETKENGWSHHGN